MDETYTTLHKWTEPARVQLERLRSSMSLYQGGYLAIDGCGIIRAAYINSILCWARGYWMEICVGMGFILLGHVRVKVAIM